MKATPRIGWREVVIAVVVPLLCAAAWMWRFADVPSSQRGAVAAASVVALGVGAALGGRRVHKVVRARRSGSDVPPDRIGRAAGLGLALIGYIVLRLFVPDAFVLVGVAAVTGMLGAGLPAYALASRPFGQRSSDARS